MGTSAPDSVKRLVDRFDQNRDATDGSQLTAYSLRPSDSEPSAVSRKPMADADRGIEDYGTLQGLIGKPGVYRRLMERFQDADGRQPTACGLQLTASVGYGIRNRPKPSAVSREPMADVLGKVIKLTDGHRAKVEEKPEVRKAGGVHYTPQYIVNYIVKNTIGKLPVGSNPAHLTTRLACVA